ncbi:hypothetical protein BS47DRAFT_1392764 [Hydnum rufescens UP504]|uniref:Uncharacterized protein n=1 Tax=Hydnum rufescens UP504 TaxID=1448309 RepID=A0A9P6DWV1_9AGAM|nr:hypothetical protein BS47DRAFT_1392764 [Hydnum rufescens UP504]
MPLLYSTRPPVEASNSNHPDVSPLQDMLPHSCRWDRMFQKMIAGLCSEADALGDGPLLMEETACFPLLDSLSDLWFAQHSESDEHLLPTSVGNPGTSISAASHSVLPASPDHAKQRKLRSQEAAKQTPVKESAVVVSAASGMQDLQPLQSGLTGSTKVTKSVEDALSQSQLSATLEQL